jgi:SNF2 family DNA or RNA helicase
VIVALDEDVGAVAKKAELADEKLKLAQAHGVPFVAVINYDSAWREPFAQWAQKVHWDLVIADEVHKIKAATGRASKFFARLAARADYRLGLTGTPMPHNHTDIFGILRFVDVAILGRYWGPFKREYCQMGGYQNKQVVAPRNLSQLEQKVARVMFRVGKEVLDLPPETLITYRCELSPEGRRVYRSLDEYFVAGVKGGTITVTNAMVKVQRLAQLTGGWVPTDDGEPYHVDDSKQKLLEDTLDDIGSTEPAVVFCWFHQDLDAVHDACRRLGYTSLELSGRHDELKKWQDGAAQTLAVQIRSGGTGVDFTRARYSIFYSLGFSLADYEQAKSRVHRPGQTRPVEHIHLVAKGTVDERIMRALEKRAEVIEAILAEIAHS